MVLVDDELTKDELTLDDVNITLLLCDELFKEKEHELNNNDRINTYLIFITHTYLTTIIFHDCI